MEENVWAVQVTELQVIDEQLIDTDPGLRVEKFVIDINGGGPNEFLDQIGDVVTYEIWTTNTGVETLTNVRVTDPSTGLDVIIDELAPGETDIRMTSNIVSETEYGLSTLDFESLTAGDVVDTQFADLGVSISTENVTSHVDAPHPAMVFDTANPTGGDADLGMRPDQGNVLIISEDNDGTNPDDNARGGTIVFEFDTPVAIDSLTLLDTEEGGTIELFDADGVRFETIAIPKTEDGGRTSFDLALGVVPDPPFENAAIDNVSTMKVTVKGSAALDDLTFCKPGILLENTVMAYHADIGQVEGSETVPIIHGFADGELFPRGSTNFFCNELIAEGRDENLVQGNRFADGQAQDDTLVGDILQDSFLWGGEENDTLIGGFGDDQLFGENGNDTFIGETGNDIWFGGPGNDVFSFLVDMPFDNDSLRDFTQGEDTVRIGTSFGESLDSFDDLDTNGNGVLDSGDARVMAEFRRTTIDLSDEYNDPAGTHTIEILNVTEMVSGDFIFG